MIIINMKSRIRGRCIGRMPAITLPLLALVGDFHQLTPISRRESPNIYFFILPFMVLHIHSVCSLLFHSNWCFKFTFYLILSFSNHLFFIPILLLILLKIATAISILESCFSPRFINSSLGNVSYLFFSPLKTRAPSICVAQSRTLRRGCNSRAVPNFTLATSPYPYSWVRG